MKKFIFLVSLLAVVLAGCGDQEQAKAEENEKEVIDLIMEGNYDESINKIDEYQLSDQFNLEQLDSLKEMEKLFNEGAYTRVLSQYKNQPITDEKLQPKSDELLIKSLEGSKPNAEVFKLAYIIVEDFDSETQTRIEEEFDIEKVKQELETETAE